MDVTLVLINIFQCGSIGEGIKEHPTEREVVVFENQDKTSGGKLET